MADESKSHELTAREVRGLAHPIRVKLLRLLRDGPATATGLAKKLGESSGVTSWHLRQLAEYGFVEEDTERGTKRERWWRSRYPSTSLTDIDLLTSDDPNVDVFLYSIATDDFDAVTRYISERRNWPKKWVSSSTISRATLSLTAAEAKEFVERMHELIDSFDRPKRKGDKQYHVSAQAFPVRMDLDSRVDE
ncbi:MAG: helix-turn-helix domain-containing protein [Sciscionella sp.]|nr:helix-turn-helix domain-containing protein [Sciscionella sp.]